MEKGPTIAGLSTDGYKGLESGKSIVYVEKTSKLRYLSFFIPKRVENFLLFQITYPKIFGKGTQQLKIKAEDGKLMFFNLKTTILEEKISQQKKYLFSPELGFDIS